MEDDIYIEMMCRQCNCMNNDVCGDVFLSNRINEESRTLAVLSDGMGSGIRANVLAMLTSSMAINFAKEHRNIRETAEIIMNTLPVCAEKNKSYSTFAIVDIDFDKTVSIVKYDNHPGIMIMRGTEPYVPDWTHTELSGFGHQGKLLSNCDFSAQIEDRIIMLTDGIVQSGMGSLNHPSGWGYDNVKRYIANTVKKNNYISAGELSGNVVNEAVNFYDLGTASHDMSCAVIYFRSPRQLLICTGPPYKPEYDHEMSNKFNAFSGKKILCGGTTIDIITRHLGLKYTVSTEISDEELPPEIFIKGVNLATEGILTLCKAASILENFNSVTLGTGPADKLVSLIMNSDSIHFLIGTGLNKAHQDPGLPEELDIRKNIIRRIADCLTSKFLKYVSLEYI